MPGGPTRSTPEGALAPSLVNLSGDLNNSCNSIHLYISIEITAVDARSDGQPQPDDLLRHTLCMYMYIL